MSDGVNGPTGTCREHGPFLYFCRDGHEQWRQANPRTAAAISEFASGRGSSAKVAAARKADERDLTRAGRP